jgi:hypothetical protein
MIVMLRHEKAEIDDGHRLSKPRVQRGPRKLVRAHPRESFDNSAADGGEIRKNA